MSVPQPARLVLTTAAHASLTRELAALRRHGCDPADGSPATRIAALEQLLFGATVIPDDERATVVAVGCAVEVEYPRTGRRARYRLIGDGAVGATSREVSARSPVGQAVMGGRVGDRVDVELPGGSVEALQILAIDPEPAA